MRSLITAGALGAAPLVASATPRILPALLVASVVGITPIVARLPPGQRGQPHVAGGFRTLLTPSMIAFLAKTKKTT